jgi:hypothetical protein
MAVSLKSWLDSNPKPTTPAGYLCLPQIGEGVQVALRRLTLGEFRQILAEQKADGEGVEKLSRVLPKCVCNHDGTPWSGPDLLDVLTLSEAASVVGECLKANSVDVADAKKASSPTP